jgi:hypothetical protein
MIDPDRVFVGRPIYHSCTPGHDRGMLELLEDRNIGAQYDHVGESSVSSARDYVAHYFLTRTDLDWLVWIDSDISFSRQDWAYLMEDQAGELAVCAEYLKKTQDLSLQVANFGLGFARIHRSVFEKLQFLTRDDGEPRLLRYRGRIDIKGEQCIEEMTEYHPIGVHPDGSRRHEDHGFWLMVRLAGVPLRIETRTRLGHTGPYTWWYDKEKMDAAIAQRGSR